MNSAASTVSPAQPLISERTKALFALLLILAAAYAWWPRLAWPVTKRKFQVPRTAYYQFQTEQSSSVEDIGRQITETIAFAAGKFQPGRSLSVKCRPSATGTQSEFQLSAFVRSFGPIEREFRAEDYLWSPENFVPWARMLLDKLQPKTLNNTPRVDEEFLTRLTNPRPDVLVREDLQISEALTKNPLNAKAHEEAALLIGSLALREATLDFMNARPAMNAMSAHLALAKSVSGDLTAGGELAEALLSSLAGRQSAAIQELELLQRRAGGVNELSLELATRWGRALKIYNTGDYRLLDQPEHASLLERLEYFRALRYSVSSQAATAFAARAPLERLAEWSARIVAGRNSVGDGNRWTARALATELEECAMTYRSYHGEPLAHDHFASALNTRWEKLHRTATGDARVDVLGWGAWAQFYQRQTCELAGETIRWLDALGLPDAEQKAREKLTADFGALELFPLVDLGKPGTAAEEQKQFEQATEVIRNNVEDIPYERFEAVSQKIERSKINSPSVSANWARMHAWFWPLLPFGTAYNVGQRAAGNQLLSLSPDELAKLQQIAPYNFSIRWTQLQRSTNFRPSRDQTTEQFNELSGYNVAAMETIANAVKDDPDRYESVFGYVCRVDPNRYIELGDYLVEQGRDRAAAHAYQDAFEYAPDRVYVANNSGWLINYYYDHERKDDAMKIASAAADVYSARGLQAMGDLMERMGNLDRAEEYFRKIEVRYKDSSRVAGFYTRNAAKSPRYAEAMKQATEKIFPNGLEHVSLTKLHDAATDGVAITGWSAVIQKVGLQRGDVLVAIDGYRCHNEQQYFFLRDASDNPEITYIFYRAGNYMERKATIPQRQIKATIADYTGR